MSSSRKQVNVMSVRAKQIARASKKRNSRRKSAEQRLNTMMGGVTFIKLSGLDIMRVRKNAAKSTLPSRRRVRSYWAFIERQQKLSTKK